MLTAAKAFGATKIVVTDVNSHNLALAEKMGATKTYLQSKPATPQDVANKLKDMLGPIGPQIVFDCVGLESTVQTAVLSCCERGRVVIVGMAQEYVSVPMNMLAAREVEMVGTQRYANTVSSASRQCSGTCHRILADAHYALVSAALAYVLLTQLCACKCMAIARPCIGHRCLAHAIRCRGSNGSSTARCVVKHPPDCSHATLHPTAWAVWS